MASHEDPRPRQGKLDQELEGTFPASDPPAVTMPHRGPSQAQQAALDEALDETFPASDPLPANPGSDQPTPRRR